jgi:Tol biopolymer transport system component
MTITAGWERVRELFQAAVEQPVATRDAFLSAECNGDEALRREVLSLLAAHDAAGGFLETPAVRIEDHAPAAPTWALQPGTRIGDFEVIAPLGAGGMGEVYRARDAQLGRDVAIKLLPPTFAADPQRLARFERESRILASLKHPNIAAIHSIEHIDGLRLLVLELVEGATLADRLKAGPLSVPDALGIARQLTDGLEAAHERGIVHRDLKPANVKLTPSGRVMLLDFGLAKERVHEDPDRPAPADASASSSAGLILGTCAYMSPEQARGQPVDKRADVWAFGCILFELLSGRRAFAGNTPSETIAAVLERQPDWGVLPDALPASVERLLRRCLEKDPQRRLHDIADARLEVEEGLRPDLGSRSAGSSSELVAERLPRSGRRPGLATVAAFAAVTAISAGAGWWARGAPPSESPGAGPTRFTWTIPAGLHLDSAPAVSPDGRHLAFTAVGDDGVARLYVRALNGLDARAIARTSGARHAFWSPDSLTLGYFAGGKMMKVAVDGGAPVEICPATNPRGGAWGRNGVIVFSPASIFSGLAQVSADGGKPEPITLLDTEQGENSHRWPAFLPDGVHFVYFVRSIVAERRGVYLGRIDRPATTPGTPLFRSESEAVYAPLDDRGRGVLLSVAGGHIDVHPFDAGRRIVTGDPSTLPLPAGGSTPHHGANLSLSANMLMHVASSTPYGQRLMSTTLTGEAPRQHAERGIVSWPRVSPDGSRLVSQLVDAPSGSPDLWVQDLERGTRVRITKEGSSGQLPVWSPDGARLAYVAGTFEKPLLTIAAADGTGVISTLRCPRFRCEPTDWSRDGRWLLVNVLDAAGPAADVWRVSTDTNGPQEAVLAESFAERDARFSPDGHLVAYVSLEIGRPEISVRTVDGTPRREVVSVSGGNQPVWSRDGTALFFVDPDGYLRKAAVKRTPGRPLVIGTAARVDVPLIGSGHYGTQYDLSPDARRVYFLDGALAERPREIGFVIGWRALLRK